MYTKSIKPRVVEHALKRQSGLGNPIRIFINFVYYLGVCPYRCERDAISGNYCKKVWRIQRVICAFLHILCLFRLISQVRETLEVNVSALMRNPTLYFSIVDEGVSFLFKMVTIKRFWFHSDDYLRVLNTIANEGYLPTKDNWCLKPGVLYTLYGFFATKVFIRVFVGYGFVAHISKWTLSWWIRGLVEQGRYVFCFSLPPNKPEAPNLASISFWEGILAVLMFFAHFTRVIFSEFCCDLLVLTFTITLWSASSSYYNDINDKLLGYFMHDKTDINEETLTLSIVSCMKDQPIRYWQKMYKTFQALQNLSEAVNIAVGAQVTWYLAEGLMYYSMYLNAILVTTDLFIQFQYMTFFIQIFLILYLSGNICTNIASTKTWLVKDNNIKSVPMDEAYIVLHEVIMKDVGIRGNHAFTITYTFIAGYVSLIATCFLICVQFPNQTTT